MIRIVTDSTCDIPREEWASWGITVVPLTITFGDRVYKDGLDLTPEAFYEKLRQATKLPKTSQVNPGEFEQVFREIVDAGDEVVGIFLSSTFSGTYQSANIAANLVSPEKIFTVDSRTTTLGMAILLREAVRMRDSGKYSAAEIASTIQKLALRVRICAVLDTLKYLKMGGRISAGVATVGGILGIMPVLVLQDGVIEIPEKAWGEKAGKRALLRQLKTHRPDLHYPVAFGNADALERMEAYMAFLLPLLETEHIFTGALGSVVGTHSGPGVVGLAYIQAES